MSWLLPLAPWAGAVAAAAAGVPVFLLLRRLRSHYTRTARRARLLGEGFQVVIVGAGFSGIGMGVRLLELGVPFVVIDKASQVGGTWHHNVYPGCACDIMSHLYSFSWAPNPSWTKAFPSQPEILRYLTDLVHRYRLREHIRLNCRMERARFDVATNTWIIDIEGQAEPLRGNVLVSAVGGLHIPALPDIDGLDSFKGLTMHTAQWDAAAWAACGPQRVGVIGSAASGVQIIPELAKESDVTLFQRTPSWIAPRNNYSYPEAVKWAFRWIPGCVYGYRLFIYFLQEFQYELIWARYRWTETMIKKMLGQHIEEHIPASQPGLREALTPEYPPGCKRLLVSDEFYSTMARDNVTLVSAKEAPIHHIEEAGVVVQSPGGGQRLVKLDALVLATGFAILTGYPRFDSREGRDLASEHWGDCPRAFLGIATDKYPNCFFCLGPNTGLGHNSVVWMIECQVEYIAQAIRFLTAGGRGRVRMEVKPESQARFVDACKAQLDGSVWDRRHCRSWYQTPGGEIFALFPGHTWSYWRVLWTAAWRLAHDYDVTLAGA